MACPPQQPVVAVRRMRVGSGPCQIAQRACKHGAKRSTTREAVAARAAAEDERDFASLAGTPAGPERAI
jgi:hypothetical protein